MKHFRVINNDMDNWKEEYREHAIDVVRLLKRQSKNYKNYEIAWKTPVTGEYHTFMTKNDNKIIINTIFAIPKVFKELI